MERETGIEPATNSLEGCDSTIELLPPAREVREENRNSKLGAICHGIFEFRFSAPSGGQGRVRTSVDRMGRQIYSLLLLTAQPPVRNWFPCGLAKTGTPFRSVFESRWFEPSSSSLRLDAGTPPFPRKAEYFSDLINPLPKPRPALAGHSRGWMRSSWSWRRDSNPRPSDYKSDALPAELRQPPNPNNYS